MPGYFLNKPYPYLNAIRRDFISYFFIGSFVAAFLIIFQPFEINLWVTNHKILKLIGFGLISFLVPALLRLIVPRLISGKSIEENWTVYKEILSILIVFTGIALCNMIYGRLLSIIPLNLYTCAMAFLATLLVGLFPISLHVILKHNRLLKFSLEQSDGLNVQLNRTLETTTPSLLLIAENEKDTLSIPANNLLFIESADNYSTIVFIENGLRKKQLLRSSLKRLENQLSHPAIMRCHRAYIVNLSKIKTVEGNAAGYRLFLIDCEDTVPVSRNYVPLLNERSKALK